MTKAEQARQVAWRDRLLQFAAAADRSVSYACRHFGVSCKTFYKWKARRMVSGAAGLCDRPRAPGHSPRATPADVVRKVLYLRQQYHFGPGKIADYLKRV